MLDYPFTWVTVSNDQVMFPSFKKYNGMFHGPDGDRASLEPCHVLPTMAAREGTWTQTAQWPWASSLRNLGSGEQQLKERHCLRHRGCGWRGQQRSFQTPLKASTRRECLPSVCQARRARGRPFQQTALSVRLPLGGPSSSTFMRCGAARQLVSGGANTRGKGQTPNSGPFSEDSCPAGLPCSGVGEGHPGVETGTLAAPALGLRFVAGSGCRAA